MCQCVSSIVFSVSSVHSTKVMKSCILAYRLFVLLKLVLRDVSPVLEVLQNLKLEWAGEGGREGVGKKDEEGWIQKERERERERERARA